MSERLTHSASASAPGWTRLTAPALALLTALVLLGLAPDVFPAVSETSHPLYRLLPTRWIVPLQMACLLLLSLSSGALLRALLPPKTAAASKAVAVAAGMSLPLFLLRPFLPEALGAAPGLAAWAFLTASWIQMLEGGLSKRRFLSALSGLLAGLALVMAPSTLAGALPAGLWLVAATVKTPKTGGVRLGLWLAGLAVGLLPLWTGRVTFHPAFSSSIEPDAVREVGRSLVDGLAWWGLALVALALLVGLLQRLPVLLGLILPTTLLLVVGNLLRPTVSDAAVLLPWTWLAAYGALRVMRGVEQGVRNVNHVRARLVPGLFVLLFAAALAGWALRLHAPLFF